MLKDLIRRWLGLDQILWNLQDIRENRLSDRKLLNKMDTQLIAILPGLGRVIAKLDANYARSEFDPAKQAESDAIGEEILRRLAAEQAVRDQYDYTPKHDYDPELTKTQSTVPSPIDGKR